MGIAHLFFYFIKFSIYATRLIAKTNYLQILLSGKHFEKEKKWAGFRKRNPAFLVYICFDEKK